MIEFIQELGGESDGLETCNFGESNYLEFHIDTKYTRFKIKLHKQYE